MIAERVYYDEQEHLAQRDADEIAPIELAYKGPSLHKLSNRYFLRYIITKTYLFICQI